MADIPAKMAHDNGKLLRPAWQQRPLSAQKRKYFYMSYYVFGSRSEMLDPLLSPSYACRKSSVCGESLVLQDAQPSTWCASRK